MERGERNRARLHLAATALIAYGFLGWPMAVLARRSLLVHMTQQCAVLLVIAPMLLVALGHSGVPALEPGRPLGRIARAVSAPLPATLFFNTVVIASFIPVVMNAAVRSVLAGAALDVALLTAGLVMWAPALASSPIQHGLGRAARAGYLIIQSVVPSFASLVFIFDRQPVYAVFRSAPRSLGLTPLVDQQLAGAFAKIVGLAVMLGAAGAILLRGDGSDDAASTQDPSAPRQPTARDQEAKSDALPEVLTWADVEQELRRVGFRENGDD